MSTAAAYPNSDDYGSEKTSAKFQRISQIRASTLAARHRDLIVSMMLKNQFGDELWMETNHIAAAMGRLCNRRKPGTITRLVKGRQQTVRLGPCDTASRRTVQRLIDDLVYCRECGKSNSAHSSTHAFVPRVEGGGVLDELYGANSYVAYGGGKHFRPSATYRLNPDRLTPRKTSKQYVEDRERNRKRKGVHRVVEIAQPHPEPVPPVPPKPPSPSAPAPAKKVAETPDGELLSERHRSRLRRRMQSIVREWKRNTQARVGSNGDEDLTYVVLVRKACDDELIDFHIAWPFLEKLWWRNEEGFRRTMKLGVESGESGEERGAE